MLLTAFLFVVQKPDMAGLAEFLKPLNNVIMKANAMTEGRRSDFFNHLKTAADSLTALAWIAFTGKECGERKFSIVRQILEINDFITCWFLNLLPLSRYEHADCTC